MIGTRQIFPKNVPYVVFGNTKRSEIVIGITLQLLPVGDGKRVLISDLRDFTTFHRNGRSHVQQKFSVLQRNICRKFQEVLFLRLDDCLQTSLSLKLR